MRSLAQGGAPHKRGLRQGCRGSGSPWPGRNLPKVKLQASHGYRSDSVRPSTHSASPGLLLFRKDRMPSARAEGPRGAEGAAGPPSASPRLRAGNPVIPSSSAHASPSQSQVQARHIAQAAGRPRPRSPSSHAARHGAGATGLGLGGRQSESRGQDLRVSTSKTQQSWFGRGS